MPLAVATHGRSPNRLRQVLAYLCCLLTLTVGTPDSYWAWSGPHAPLEGESEERPVNDENEDGKEGEGKRDSGEEDALRHARPRRLARGGDPSPHWLAHLPHHHGGISGYTLPICSPFTHAALLPLRC